MISKKRWINVAKSLAILAVLTDHLRGTLYASEMIQRVTFFSVTLFILLMGVTTFWSFDNSEIAIHKKVGKRLIAIIIPYITAVLIFHFVSYKGFYWNEYIDSLIHFKASGPHYYVLLYIQLLIISPVVYYIIISVSKKFKKNAFVFELMFTGGCIVLAWICNTRTDFAGIYAGKLFGGSYILCLYIGMLFGKYYNNIIKIDKKQVNILIAGVLSVIVLFLGILIFNRGFFLDRFPILGSVINPPGVTEIIYAFFIMIAICFWGRSVGSSSVRGLDLPIICLSYVGEQTLYIFLYHRLFLDYFLNRFFIGFSIYIRIPMFYLIMIFGSIAIGYLYKYFIKLVKSSYLYVKG